MILQRDVRLLTPIQRFGCYYMDIAFLANKYTNCALDAERLNDGYEDCVYAGYMGENCFVDRPAKIFHYFGLAVHYRNEHTVPEYVCGLNELEILFFEWDRLGKKPWPHFVVGDGAGHVAYDPWGVATAVIHGELRSKRIFTR